MESFKIIFEKMSPREKTLLLVAINMILLAALVKFIFLPSLFRYESAKEDLNKKKIELSNLETEISKEKITNNSFDICMEKLSEEDIKEQILNKGIEKLCENIEYSPTAKERNGHFKIDGNDVYSMRARLHMKRSDIPKLISKVGGEGKYVLSKLFSEENADKMEADIKFFSVNKHHDMLYAADEDTFGLSNLKSVTQNLHKENLAEENDDDKKENSSEKEKDTEDKKEAEALKKEIAALKRELQSVKSENGGKVQLKDKTASINYEKIYFPLSENDVFLNPGKSVLDYQIINYGEGSEISFSAIKKSKGEDLSFIVEFMEPKKKIFYPPSKCEIKLKFKERTTDNIGLYLMTEDREFIKSPILEGVPTKEAMTQEFTLSAPKDKYPIYVYGIYYEQVGGVEANNVISMEGLTMFYEK